MLISEIPCSDSGCSGKSVLPRRSRLGRFESLPDPSMDAWPAVFLCRRCGLLTVGFGDKTRQNTAITLGPSLGIPRGLWQVAFECGRENCGEPHAIYAQWIEGDSSENVGALVAKAVQMLPCRGSHHAQIAATTEPELWPF
jgi:hypothetical protein